MLAATVWEIDHGANQNLSHFEIHTGNFLDEFYRSSPEKRQRMVEQEPDHHNHLPVPLLPFLAGMVHKLCNDYGLDCPDWVHNDKYFLPEPHFAFNAKGNLRIILLVESPVEFKIRNIFTTANTLNRI